LNEAHILIDDLDSKLQEKAESLSLASVTHVLDNWRQLLAEKYKEPLPWWLDGTLERLWDKVRRENEAPWVPDVVFKAIQKKHRELEQSK